MNAASAIVVESLSKSYRSGAAQVSVLRSLSFSVASGESVAIVGESGCGKSTLLHLLGGLDRPDSGSIRFGDTDIAGLGPVELATFRNRKLGFVWQNPSLLPEFTAAENVAMPLLIRGSLPGKAARIASERLSDVGLATRADHRAGELSGGEQQRVALARALAGEPQFLLADEPTGSLDMRTGDMVMSLIGELCQAHSLTFILVTHNLPFARRCDRVLELKKGQLQHYGNEVVAHEVEVVQGATRLDGGTYV